MNSKQNIKWTLEITHKAEKKFSRLPKAIQRRIVEAFESLTVNPYLGKKLRGKHDGFYRYTVSDYRILYTLEKERIVIVIVKIINRKDAYKLPL